MNSNSLTEYMKIEFQNSISRFSFCAVLYVKIARKNPYFWKAHQMTAYTLTQFHFVLQNNEL